MRKFKFTVIALAAMLMAACGDDNSEPSNNNGNTDNNQTVATDAAPSDIIFEANPRMYGGNGTSLVSLKNHLSEIKKTGATILWVMPVNSPGEDSKAIGSPYCVKDYKGVNSRLGTMQDLKDLVSAAHQQGMKIILDWVANHTSWDNAWIAAHPDWYVQDASGNIQSPSSWTDVAELNYDNREMRAAMIDALLYWVNEVGIDGYRFDNVDGVPHDFWAEACKALKGVNQDMILLAESSDTECYTDGFNYTYAWSYGPALANLFAGKKDFTQLVAISDKEFAAAPSEISVMRYAVNHDTMSETGNVSLYGGVDGTECAYAIAMMSGGTPMIYSSQLTAQTGTLSFFNYYEATWDSTRIENLSRLASAFSSTYKVRCGTFRSYSTSGVVMERVLGQKHLVLVANPTSKEATLRVPIEVAGSNVENLLTGDKEYLSASVTLPAYGYALYLK